MSAHALRCAIVATALATGTRALRLVHLDRCTAVTVVHLWHELHECRRIAHDFAPMLGAHIGGMFVGISDDHRIRAVAHCQRDTLWTLAIHGVAHPPERYVEAAQMIRLLRESNTLTDWNAMRRQPRWYMEELYLLAETTAAADDRSRPQELP